LGGTQDGWAHRAQDDTDVFELVAGSADPDGDVDSGVIVLRTGQELQEGQTFTRLAQRDTDVGQDLAGTRVGLVVVQEEVAQAQLAPVMGALEVNAGIESKEGDRRIEVGITMGQVATDGAGVADARGGYFGESFSQGWIVFRQELGSSRLVVGGDGAQADTRVGKLDASQFGHLLDVHEDVRLQEALAHQEDEGGTAGEDLAIVGMCLGQLAGFGEGMGLVIGRDCHEVRKCCRSFGVLAAGRGFFARRSRAGGRSFARRSG